MEQMFLGEKKAKTPEHYRALNKKNRDKARWEVFAILGDHCRRCGFSDRRALQIDHVHGDGFIERKQMRMNWWRLYREIKTNGPRGRYQLLCANCNQIKKIENREHHDRWK